MARRAMEFASMFSRSPSNIRLKFARCARPTRKGEAPLLAAQPGR